MVLQLVFALLPCLCRLGSENGRHSKNREKTAKHIEKNVTTSKTFQCIETTPKRWRRHQSYVQCAWTFKVLSLRISPSAGTSYVSTCTTNWGIGSVYWKSQTFCAQFFTTVLCLTALVTADWTAAVENYGKIYRPLTYPDAAAIPGWQNGWLFNKETILSISKAKNAACRFAEVLKNVRLYHYR